MLVTILAVSGCAETSPSSPDRAAEVAVNFISSATTRTIVLEITGTGIQGRILQNISIDATGRGNTQIVIPTGAARRFLVTALDTFRMVTHKADTTLDVRAEGRTTLVLQLHPTFSKVGLTARNLPAGIAVYNGDGSANNIFRGTFCLATPLQSLTSTEIQNRGYWQNCKPFPSDTILMTTGESMSFQAYGTIPCIDGGAVYYCSTPHWLSHASSNPAILESNRGEGPTEDNYRYVSPTIGISAKKPGLADLVLVAGENSASPTATFPIVRKAGETAVRLHFKVQAPQ